VSRRLAVDLGNDKAIAQAKVTEIASRKAGDLDAMGNIKPVPFNGIDRLQAGTQDLRAVEFPFDDTRPAFEILEGQLGGAFVVVSEQSHGYFVPWIKVGKRFFKISLAFDGSSVDFSDDIILLDAGSFCGTLP